MKYVLGFHASTEMKKKQHVIPRSSGTLGMSIAYNDTRPNKINAKPEAHTLGRGPRGERDGY